MSRWILKDIIEDFQVEKFIRFFRTKNNKFRFPNESLSYKDDDFKEARKIAEAELEDGNLIVCSFLVKQPLSERSGKKAQYDLGKKILKESQVDAGIFIFYDDRCNFRFSLIYTNYLGRRRDWSNFRRFTYFVSKELTNKTFLQRIGEGDFSTLEKVKDAFSVEKVTKEFYTEIANWYFWAVQESKFPEDAEREENGRNIAIIRLITRMIFIWFMKVRKLIPDELFNINNIKEILKDLSSNESTYYKAILQNLFFATLNTRQEERKFRTEIRGYRGYNPDFGNHSVYRYHSLFKNSEKMREYFENIPFLNGGLFDCLDYKSKKKEERFYIDGFTDTKQYQPYVPNFLFFTEERNVDLNQEYGTKGKRYKVRGLINILSSFNFTIDENEPDDFEVALDPELLGRVFENLLASYNPETATTARKATGSYNTPREIVDYMVTQSLTNYFKTHLFDVLDIDAKLSELFSKENHNNPFNKTTTKKIISLIEGLRIVDPAVGSGAFPMGILNKLVFILSKLDPQNTLWKETQIDAVYKNIKDPVLQNKFILQIEKQFQDKNPDYGRKLYLIEKCIYGVDIQQIAVEIAKLRFFISLLVDEKINPNKPNFGIEPLPNLDFKLIQGNSLISSFAGIDFGKREGLKDKGQVSFAFTTRYDELIKQFEDTKNQYQNEPDKDKKDKLRKKIEELILQIFEEKLDEHLPEFRKIEESASKIPNPKQREDYITAEKQKLAKKYGFDLELAQKELIAYTEGRKPKNFFLWDVYFAEVFSGENPGFDIVIANPPYIGEKGHKQIFREVKQGSLGKFYMGKMDYFYFFFHLSLNIAKDKAKIAFITTNYYPTATGAKKLRQDFKERTIIRNLINFNELKIFESALGQHNMITILEKAQNENVIAQTCITQRQGFATSEILHQMLNGIDSETRYYRVNLKDLYDGKECYIRLTGTRASKISENPIQKILDKLKDQGNALGQICNINSGADITISKITDKHLKNFKGNFNKMDGVFVLEADEIQNLKLSKQEQCLLKRFIKNSDIFSYGVKLTSEKLIYLKWEDDINKFPNIKSHLLRFKKILEDQQERYEESYPWFALHRPREQCIFEANEKILVPYRNKKNVFGYSTIPIYSSRDVFFITKRDNTILLKYVLALLNSELYYLWLYYRGKRKGEALELYQKPLSEIPIKKIPENEQKPFINIVDKILSITKDDDYLENPTKQAKVKEYERQIDQLVYSLYGLTQDEIKIVENFNKD